MSETHESKDQYICDDRNVMENLQKIRLMTDEEFEAYVAEHEKNK